MGSNVSQGIIRLEIHLNSNPQPQPWALGSNQRSSSKDTKHIFPKTAALSAASWGDAGTVKMADGCLTLEELHPIQMTGGIIRATDPGYADW